MNLTNLSTKVKVGAWQHVQVQQLLTNPEDLTSYQELVVALLFTSNIISTDSWSSYARRFSDLASVLAGAH